MPGIFSVALLQVAPRCHVVQSQAGVLALLSPSFELQQMKSSLVPPLTCQHGLAVGKHERGLFKNSVAPFLSSSVKQSATCAGPFPIGTQQATLTGVPGSPSVSES